MSKKTVAGTAVEERIARRAELESLIAGISREINTLSNVHQLAIAASEARERVNSFILRRGNGNEAKIPESWVGEFRQLKEDAEKKVSAHKRADDRFNSLKENLAGLKAELESIEFSAKIEDVVKYQNQITDAEQLISDLNQAIAKERENVDVGNTSSQALEELNREKEDLLAELALGNEIDKGRLKDIEKRIEEETAKAEELRRVASQSESIISGLKRKVAVAEESLNELKSTQQTVYLYFLFSLAEKAGNEYATLAHGLTAKARRIIAIGKMIEKHPDTKGSSPIYTGHNEGFKVPAFNLKSTESTEKVDKWILSGVSQSGISGEMEAVRQEVEVLGIRIPV